MCKFVCCRAVGTETDPFDVDIGKVHFSVPRVQAALRF